MTQDRRKAVIPEHAAATGRSRLDSATSTQGTPQRPMLASRLHADLIEAMERAGWPVEVEHAPQHAGLCFYPGPAVVHVTRTTPPEGSLTGDEHPDDPDLFDLNTPLKVVVWAPLITNYSDALGRVGGIDGHEISADRPVAEIVSEIDKLVGEARRRDIADTPDDTECGICGDCYPAGALLIPTRTRVPVCPCCTFDGDLLGPLPAQLAWHIDDAASTDLATAAGWTAVQTLLCCLDPTIGSWLQSAWRAHGNRFTPRPWWGDPNTAWIWLPPANQRPPALADLGCGASIATITAAVDRFHPGLRAACRARREQEIDESLVDEYGDALRSIPEAELKADRDRFNVSDATFDHFWPAAVAYTVALLTQQAERPGRRSPWHVMMSFELPDWVDALGSEFGHYHVETVLRIGIVTIRDALDPRSPEYDDE